MKWFEPYLAVPFVERGRDLKGWDCWGAVRFILSHHAGLPLPSFDDGLGDEIPERHASIADDWIEVGEARPFDVATVLVPTRQGAFPFHVAIIVDPPFAIHAARKIGTVCVRLRTLKLGKIYRHKSLA